MFPPGRIIFLRPIKLLDPKQGKKERGVKHEWDAVWTTPQELVGEGILVSKKAIFSPPPLRFRDALSQLGAGG
jgi:hypothetical protein